MTAFLFLLSLFLAAGLGLVGFMLSNQTATIKVVEATSKLAGDELAKCRATYAEMKTRAETHIHGLMERVKQENAKVVQYGQLLAVQNEKMKRWQVISDAEAEAERVVEVARQQYERSQVEAARLTADAATHVQEAHRQAEQMVVRAKQKAAELSAGVKPLLEQANLRARDIVAAAERQAVEIMGEAAEVKQNVSKYEQLLRAIKNEIDGYGDQYIIPVHSLLDDLAEEVGYSMAGQQLKTIRNLVKQMVKDGQAGECDYAEANRRETAIRFVVDAFNGKVDSILSRVKADNVGKLQQQINDSFSVVNGNGEAFRNARITLAFLQARLEELKWACIAHEIKKQEQAEQRRLKERIRDEEKAKREFERAIKVAAKEEHAMRSADAKIREQMEQALAEERERMAQASAEERELLERASEEQRAMYEAQLATIQTKMLEIEEKGRRALSMAQQTKKGNVYIISNFGSFGEHVYKIGLTRRLDPHERVRELGDSSVPFEFDIHALIEAEDAPALEHRLHKHFVLHQVNKVNHRKEFFRCQLATIRSEVESLGLNATWTMSAAAQDYRETQAIEKRIADDPLAKQRWIERQYDLEDSEDGRSLELVSVAAGDDDEDEV